ncbi:MAG: hypothetical protein ABWZ99_17260 [Ilumatobacteraceae bacterium]
MMSQLQQVIDRLWLVSWQRWTFVAVTVLAATAASMICAFEAGHSIGVVVVLVAVLAVAAASSPDSHTALAVVGIVVWQWLASTDDVTSASAIPVALCLFAFHTVIALMAVTPISAVVDRSILLKWAERCGYVAVGTIAMWVLAFVMHERRAPGNALLTFVGFVALILLVVAARVYSTPPADGRQSSLKK